MSIAESLVKEVKKFQEATGEDQLTVLVENQDQTLGIHRVGYSPYMGLLVDGKPPSTRWHQQAESFHALDRPPAILH